MNEEDKLATSGAVSEAERSKLETLTAFIKGFMDGSVNIVEKPRTQLTKPQMSLEQIKKKKRDRKANKRARRSKMFNQRRKGH